MLPDNALSTTKVSGDFIWGASGPNSRLICTRLGGAGFSDPSRGLLFQRWTSRVSQGGNSVSLSSPSSPAEIIQAGSAITDFSFSFDRNMRLNFVWVDRGVTRLRWYDTIAGADSVMNLGTGIRTPKICMDDKRPESSETSDIILAYEKDGALMYRQQRDRYSIERRLNYLPISGISNIGMNSAWRFQFEVF